MRDPASVRDDLRLEPATDGDDEVVVPRLHENAVHLDDAALDAALVHRRDKLDDLQIRSSTPRKWTLSSCSGASSRPSGIPSVILANALTSFGKHFPP